MLRVHREWVEDGKINASSLMNAIWTCYPEYASLANAEEQVRHYRRKNLIVFSSESGTDLLYIWLNTNRPFRRKIPIHRLLQ